jgi:hypothetical protein
MWISVSADGMGWRGEKNRRNVLKNMDISQGSGMGLYEEMP